MCSSKRHRVQFCVVNRAETGTLPDLRLGEQSRYQNGVVVSECRRRRAVVAVVDAGEPRDASIDYLRRDALTVTANCDCHLAGLGEDQKQQYLSSEAIGGAVLKNLDAEFF